MVGGIVKLFGFYGGTVITLRENDHAVSDGLARRAHWMTRR
jgi:hypothetical protein